MKVLGISPLDKDSTVTLVEDGVITYAAAEERFTRVKLQDGFPWRALDDALQATGTTAGEIDTVVYPFLTVRRRDEAVPAQPGQGEGLSRRDRRPTRPSTSSRTRRRACPRTGRRSRALRIRTSVIEKGLAQDARLSGARQRRHRLAQHRQARIRAVGRAKRPPFTSAGSGSSKARSTSSSSVPKLKRVEHHLSHAANAYYTSGFDSALIVTLDGYGSGLSGSVSVGRDGRIERVHDQEYPHSLGTFYESVTSALGFTPSRHEGKIVGLAAYGDPAVLWRPPAQPIHPGERRLSHRRDQQRVLRQAAGEPVPEDRCRSRVSAHPRGSRHDLCGALRRRRPGCATWCLSGGVVANVKLNQRLRAIEGVEGIFVHPNMGDGGCGTGAALLEFAGSAATQAADQGCLPRARLLERRDRRGAPARAAALCRATTRSSRRSRC